MEIVALGDALVEVEPALKYYDALAAVLADDAVDEGHFNALSDAVSSLPAAIGKARVASWPVLTVVPFLARPDVHLLLKPKAMKLAANRLGFELNYSATLNWETYRRFLELGTVVRNAISQQTPET